MPEIPILFIDDSSGSLKERFQLIRQTMKEKKKVRVHSHQTPYDGGKTASMMDDNVATRTPALPARYEPSFHTTIACQAPRPRYRSPIEEEDYVAASSPKGTSGVYITNQDSAPVQDNRNESSSDTAIVYPTPRSRHSSPIQEEDYVARSPKGKSGGYLASQESASVQDNGNDHFEDEPPYSSNNYDHHPSEQDSPARALSAVPQVHVEDSREGVAALQYNPDEVVRAPSPQQANSGDLPQMQPSNGFFGSPDAENKHANNGDLPMKQPSNGFYGSSDPETDPMEGKDVIVLSDDDDDNARKPLDGKAKKSGRVPATEPQKRRNLRSNTMIPDYAPLPSGTRPKPKPKVPEPDSYDTCPICDEDLPALRSAVLTELLISIYKRRSVFTRVLDPSGRTNTHPRVARSPRDALPICERHRAENFYHSCKNLVLPGLDFQIINLIPRIDKLLDNLVASIKKDPMQSVMYRFITRYHNKDKEFLSYFLKFAPTQKYSAYYGFQGRYLLDHCLGTRFQSDDGQAVFTLELIPPKLNFAVIVVPEIFARLIAEDQGCPSDAAVMLLNSEDLLPYAKLFSEHASDDLSFIDDAVNHGTGLKGFVFGRGKASLR